MKISRSYISILISAILAAGSCFAQNLDNKGQVSNKGTIIVKGMVTSDSGAKIQNDSLVIIEGNAFIDQDTLGGRVEYIQNDQNSPYQIIPQLSYSTVIFKGRTVKKFENQFGRSFVSLDTFYTARESVLSLLQNEWIYLKGRVTHNSNINPAFSYGKMRLEGLDSQDIDGLGNFKILELDNFKGSDVVNRGGFKIDRQLELTNGEFRNSKDSNFTMASNSLIIRSGGSLREEPAADSQYNVRYIGDYAHRTGGEIPSADSVLADLEVLNTKGLTLSKNVTVNNQLTVGSKIFTDPATDTLFEVAINNYLDPLYLNYNAEVDGTIRRLKLRAMDTLWLNNKYTYVHFADDASIGVTKELASRIKPKVYPNNSEKETKVIRYFHLSGKDTAGLEMLDGFNAKFGYGFRSSRDTALDETNKLNIPDLVLLKWNGSAWIPIVSSYSPKLDTTEWAYSFAESITEFGEYAIGIDKISTIIFRSFVNLEGPYRNGAMQRDLNLRQRLPLTPPKDIYPFNMVPNVDQIKVAQIPDSVVDWIVLEFKESLEDLSPDYKVCFLKYDGGLVDLDGIYPVVIRDFNLDDDTTGGYYYVAVHHRNHLAIITDSAIAVYPNTESVIYDFRNPSLVEGSVNALKIVDIDSRGNPVYAMIGGYNPKDTTGLKWEINLFDRQSVWENMNKEDYDVEDFNLDGIITTRDYNISWNNRKRFGFLK